MQDIVETYRTSSDDDLIRLHADISNLTPEARQALLNEIGRRHLTDLQVATVEEQNKRAKTPTRWRAILAQLGISVLFGFVSIPINVGILEFTGPRPSGAVEEGLGRLATDAIIVIFGLSMAFGRGKIRVTVIIGSVVVALLATYVAVLLVRS